MSSPLPAWFKTLLSGKQKAQQDTLRSTRATTRPLYGHPRLSKDASWRDTDMAPRLVIFSGAGLSKESGMEFYRGDPQFGEVDRVEDLCSAQTWRPNRVAVEAFYERRYKDLKLATPHEGHAWCALMEQEGAVLMTQNIDTLLEKSGAKHVAHLQGRLDCRKCFACDFRWRRRGPWENTPACPSCKSQDTRVDVVFFQESAPVHSSAERVLAGLRECDVLVIVGAGLDTFNPLRLLKAPPQVWVVDPTPPQVLLSHPRLRTWNSLGSQLPRTVGVAWTEHLQASKLDERPSA